MIIGLSVFVAVVFLMVPLPDLDPLAVALLVAANLGAAAWGLADRLSEGSGS